MWEGRPKQSPTGHGTSKPIAGEWALLPLLRIAWAELTGEIGVALLQCSHTTQDPLVWFLDKSLSGGTSSKSSSSVWYCDLSLQLNQQGKATELQGRPSDSTVGETAPAVCSRREE